MNQANVEMLERAAECLGELLEEVVFVGGATVELWLTDEAAPEFRPTNDVDVIVEITTRREYHRFEKRLRTLGLEHDTGSGVICRFKEPGSELLLDVMPTEASILGFENRWQAEAFSHSVSRSLPSGQEIRAIPPPFLLATKLEAFDSRGEEDFYGSRDFSDAVALIDGREELIAEIAAAPPSLRKYIADRFLDLAQNPRFENGVEGALAAGPEARERFELVVQPRITSLTT